MVITASREGLPRVLLLEPNHQLRSAILEVLSAEHFHVEPCTSFDDVLHASHGDARPTVALVAWQSMEGLLAEEHRHALGQLAQRVRLVVMVPRRWARLLEATDLGEIVAGLVAKPFEADELLQALNLALAGHSSTRVTSS